MAGLTSTSPLSATMVIILIWPCTPLASVSELPPVVVLFEVISHIDEVVLIACVEPAAVIACAVPSNARNPSSLECSSQYTTDRGPVCTTYAQRKYVGEQRGLNKTYGNYSF